ncbi:hypothetical protein CBS101457_002959 [Exobasidium rhododendri]|nr:hypothetical protein CBS101457_002959 [Exobasidium rhododendri]
MAPTKVDGDYAKSTGGFDNDFSFAVSKAPPFENYGFPMITEFKVAFCELEKPDVHPEKTQYQGSPKTSTVVLPAGHVKAEGFGRKPLPCDMHYDRNIQIAMRDGTKIYVDVFRPVTTDIVPTIIAWSPYGKTGTGDMTYDKTGPYNCGISPDSVSGYHQFEAPDPAEWTHRGYAVINVDARGAFDSEGHMMRWGPQEALDIYDTTQWAVEQDWSNKAVTMSGNSWLAVAQINAAARCAHPALKCIAPWEGHSVGTLCPVRWFTLLLLTHVYTQDHYKDVMVRGGIPQVAFGNWMQSTLVGRNKMEDTAAMAKLHPFHDKYWKTKAIPVQDITVPMYLVASYSSFIHTAGSLRTWKEAKSKEKWIRFHNAQEWSDLYTP